MRKFNLAITRMFVFSVSDEPTPDNTGRISTGATRPATVVIATVAVTVLVLLSNLSWNWAYELCSTYVRTILKTSSVRTASLSDELKIAQCSDIYAEFAPSGNETVLQKTAFFSWWIIFKSQVYKNGFFTKMVMVSICIARFSRFKTSKEVFCSKVHKISQ